MYTKLKLLAVILGFALLSGLAWQTSPSFSTSESAQNILADETKRIEQLLQSQIDCWNAGDIDGFMQTYWQSEDLTFSSGGRTTRGWQATLDRYKANYNTPEKMGHLTFSELETTLLSDSIAMVLGTWRLEFVQVTQQDPMQGRFTLVLQTFNGQWKIVHDHTSLLQPKTE